MWYEQHGLTSYTTRFSVKEQLCGSTSYTTHFSVEQQCGSTSYTTRNVYITTYVTRTAEQWGVVKQEILPQMWRF